MTPRTVLSLFVFVPLLAQLFVFVAALATMATRAGPAIQWSAMALAAALGGIVGLRDARRPGLPQAWARRYGPALGLLLAIWLWWVVDMQWSGGDFTRTGLHPLLGIVLLLPWLGLGAGVATVGGKWVLLAVPSLAYAGYLAFLAWGSRKVPTAGRSHAVPVAAVFTLLLAVAAWQFQQREQKLAPRIAGAEVGEELNLHEYRPFSKHNRLVPVEAAAKRFEVADAPRLDGATGAYPLYAALVQAFYTPEAANGMVAVSRTSRAYDRLIAGEVDAIFVAQPSEAHEKLAREKGVKLQLTPVAREAFVFVVSDANPVRGLTAEQVRRIYAGEIRRWEEVGGTGGDIVAYQLPENSGSQTVMKARVMQGQPMRAALEEEVVRGMGGLVRRVAAYRNSPQSLGYSFRFYATQMHRQGGLRLLAIDGAAPGSAGYPYMVDVYMVTSDQSRPGTERLRDWLLGPQGQKLVEDSGLVRR
ncbi:MAG: substrate-binding domain-containing protein [Burkholderiales bacterium]|nr:substrate-binding domain-containing protein [Burkholderiales bacterium]